MPIDPELLAAATPEEIARYRKALRMQLALSSPADYASAVSGSGFLRPPHVDMINAAVADLVEHRLLKPDGTPYKKLMVACPPRHGKSHLLSTYTPAWFLTKYPKRKVVVAGYESSFAESWGRKVRDLLIDAPEGLAPALRKDTTAAARWETVAGGGMFTAGVGGPLTGRGAHLAIVDDPVKNWQDAQSETMRETAYDWFRSTLLTRIEPGGVTVIIQTRWHSDDLSGRLLTDEGDEWYQLVLPAVAVSDDPLGRELGQPLWPERYDEAELDKIRVSVGPTIWSSLYQQSPYVEGGGIFRGEKARFYARRVTQDKEYLVMSGPESEPMAVPRDQIGTFGVVDLAASTKTTADYSVFSLWGITPPTRRDSEAPSEDTRRLLLLDSFRARIEGADHMATLDRLHRDWKPRFWGIERATFGLTLLQTAARTGRIPVRELKPDWDKVSRAYSAAALMEAGRLWFPRDARWMDDWLAEMLAFPTGRHDDMVDCTAYAALVLSERLHGVRPPRQKEAVTVQDRIWAQVKKRRREERRGAGGPW